MYIWQKYKDKIYLYQNIDLYRTDITSEYPERYIEGGEVWEMMAVPGMATVQFFNAKKDQRIILITTKGIKEYTKFKFRVNDTILFGRESAGVPIKVHQKVNEKLKIPMVKNKRSLNLASSVAIVLAEQLRQIIN